MFENIVVPETPCIVVDEAIVRKNIEQMQQEVTACGCTLRPHIKTHKIPYFAAMQEQAGCKGISCAKISEAEVMAEGGAQDIFIAYPLVGDFRIKRALKLREKVQRLILAVDSLQGAQALSRAAQEAGVVWEVRLEVDTGAKRTGVQGEAYVALGKEIASLPGLSLTGIYTFKSLVLGGQPTTDHRAAGEEEARIIYDMAQALAKEGVSIRDISAGSTPTGLDVARTGLVTEVRPGTYIFGDYMLLMEEAVAFDDIAVRLYATVVSTPAPDYAVIDGGTKTFPMDIFLDTAPYFYPGYAILLDSTGKPNENLQLRRMNEEHGMVTAKNGVTGLRVGQVLELVPIHVCTAVNMQNYVFVKKEDKLEKMAVAARGMLV